jgi:hypothetical protein
MREAVNIEKLLGFLANGAAQLDEFDPAAGTDPLAAGRMQQEGHGDDDGRPDEQGRNEGQSTHAGTVAYLDCTRQSRSDNPHAIGKAMRRAGYSLAQPVFGSLRSELSRLKEN